MVYSHLVDQYFSIKQMTFDPREKQHIWLHLGKQTNIVKLPPQSIHRSRRLSRERVCAKSFCRSSSSCCTASALAVLHEKVHVTTLSRSWSSKGRDLTFLGFYNSGQVTRWIRYQSVKKNLEQLLPYKRPQFVLIWYSISENTFTSWFQNHKETTDPKAAFWFIVFLSW